MHRIIRRRKFISLESSPDLKQKGRGLVCRRAKHSDFSLKSKKLQLLGAIENHAQNL